MTVLHITTYSDENGREMLSDKSIASMLFKLIQNTFTKEELEEAKRCPVCNNKTSFKMHKYFLTKHMAEILFEMRRIIVSDPGQSEYIMMREERRSVRENEKMFSMVSGSQQNHKMVWLDLIYPIDHEFKKYDPAGKCPRLRSAYKISERGYNLMYGKTISPFQIHRRCGKTIITEEDKISSGTILDAKAMTFEDYEAMCQNADITSLLLPKQVTEKCQTTADVQ